MPSVRIERLGFPIKTADPFLFLVYHKDSYPPGNAKMEAPKVGNGSDFDPDAPYRMYHGNKIPGFPQHPHRGFETITATMCGIIDHSDSLGCSGRYGMGDLQWMTAGKGIVHGENFPLINQDKRNENRFFQIWINLPEKNKMVEPTQIMHWAEKVPKVDLDNGKVKVTVWAGEYNGVKSLAPPPKSWASDPANDVAIYFFKLTAGASVSVPAGNKGSNRSLYFVEGDAFSVNGELVDKPSRIVVENAADTLELSVPSDAKTDVEILLLQGKPIAENVVQHGPFVMNTRQQIQQAFMDYQKTRFGGWPWKEDAVVFPREKGRFVSVNGVEENPPNVMSRSESDL
ncbi:hypothetical protein HK096_002592 [Nowakowskiella sp. JEL0078]|nr:hypothetical protein HK096_002592 [Nowakowskiella sp. JEL0078]